jgi:hypothetical protein
MTAKTSIEVTYKLADEWHVFSCIALPGLYVASKNAKVAYEDVANSIEKLIQLNEGITCKAAPELSFQQFIQHPEYLEQNEGSDEILVLEPRRFSISREMAAVA